MRSEIFTLALLLLPGLTVAQEQPNLDVALKRAREHAYYAARVDWRAVESHARSLASEQDEASAIRFVLKSLDDRHSFYLPPRNPTKTARTGGQPDAQPSLRALSQARQAVGGVPVIQINGWSGTQQEALAATGALRSDLANTLSVAGCGIVLDFSTNTGGNMWPMLVGLSPLLEEGRLGGFKDVNGAVHVIEKKAGVIFSNDAVHMLNVATTLQPRHAAASIAIVLGPRSASSGEIVPIMFHGQHNVRLFGQRTAGKSTANSTYPLPNGGYVAITTAVTLDRNGHEFDGYIEPDVLSGQAVESAAQWIVAQCRKG